MRTLVALAAMALLAGTAGSARAANIHSPAIPTLHSTTFEGGTLINTSGACYIRNVGVTPITLEVSFFQNFGSPLAASFQNCNQAPLPPGRTCVALINDLPDDVVFSCSASVRGSAKNLRATLEHRGITSAGFKILAAEDLR